VCVTGCGKGEDGQQAESEESCSVHVTATPRLKGKPLSVLAKDNIPSSISGRKEQNKNYFCRKQLQQSLFS